MALELVGKRCLCASGGEALELAGISRWSWRAGTIRATTDPPALLTVCVHWDGEQSAERKWRRLREECEVVLLEQELVWAAKRTGTNGSSSAQEKRRLQPALRFRPLIGQSCVGGLSVVEFISDRQLEFFTEKEELQPFELDQPGVSLAHVAVVMLWLCARLRSSHSSYDSISPSCLSLSQQRVLSHLTSCRA